MLTDPEARRLLDAVKTLVSANKINFPSLQSYITLEASSSQTSDRFQIDIQRKTLNVKKCTYQTRYKKSINLLRIDIEGPAHPNPDGTEIPCPHIHIYREGYDDKWAYPLSSEIITDPNDLVQVLINFLEYNNINKIPEVISQIEVN
ncbi:hypothetical protein H8B09_17080 [Paenibacillus sp. PR3]|uniref:Uncharacterized protein n=1 Tax=Paenibacillus terricola TaxID=2763503 RepID=A0ABR8N1Y1_9BACL|nr:hypothetical protein [Paenibacillus terricola]MBD3920479.1 hypothetical protein [Paenibacillus terricola]